MRPIDADSLLQDIEDLRQSPMVNDYGNADRITKIAMLEVFKMCIDTTPTLEKEKI